MTLVDSCIVVKEYGGNTEGKYQQIRDEKVIPRISRVRSSVPPKSESGPWDDIYCGISYCLILYIKSLSYFISFIGIGTFLNDIPCRCES
jgi:hypothetical protein